MIQAPHKDNSPKSLSSVMSTRRSLVTICVRDRQNVVSEVGQHCVHAPRRGADVEKKSHRTYGTDIRSYTCSPDSDLWATRRHACVLMFQTRIFRLGPFPCCEQDMLHRYAHVANDRLAAKDSARTVIRLSSSVSVATLSIGNDPAPRTQSPTQTQPS